MYEVCQKGGGRRAPSPRQRSAENRCRRELTITLPRCPTVTQNAFSRRIEQEFVGGSGIHPTLYQAATSLVEDTECFAGGDVSYPIHEALNWHLTRFGRQARQTLQAVLLCNEDGSTWQAKLSTPRTDAKGKAQKYETPVGNERCQGVSAPRPTRHPATHQRTLRDRGVLGGFVLGLVRTTP